jgi:hypothetical protein
LEKAAWFLTTHPQYALVNSWSLGFGYKDYMWENGFQNGDRNLEENLITIALMMNKTVLQTVGMFDEDAVSI